MDARGCVPEDMVGIDAGMDWNTLPLVWLVRHSFLLHEISHAHFGSL